MSCSSHLPFSVDLVLILLESGFGFPPALSGAVLSSLTRLERELGITNRLPVLYFRQHRRLGRLCRVGVMAGCRNHAVLQNELLAKISECVPESMLVFRHWLGNRNGSGLMAMSKFSSTKRANGGMVRPYRRAVMGSRGFVAKGLIVAGVDALGRGTARVRKTVLLDTCELLERLFKVVDGTAHTGMRAMMSCTVRLLDQHRLTSCTVATH